MLVDGYVDPIGLLDRDFETTYRGMPPYFWSKVAELLRADRPWAAAALVVYARRQGCKTEQALRALAGRIERGELEGVH